MPRQLCLGSAALRLAVRARGRHEPWLDTSPPDPAGIRPDWTRGGTLTPNGRYYVYSYSRTLSDLFVVEGLR